MLNFRFDIGDTVVLRPPHPLAGRVGQVEELPGSTALRYGVRIDEDEPLLAVLGDLLDAVATGVAGLPSPAGIAAE